MTAETARETFQERDAREHAHFEREMLIEFHQSNALMQNLVNVLRNRLEPPSIVYPVIGAGAFGVLIGLLLAAPLGFTP